MYSFGKSLVVENASEFNAALLRILLIQMTESRFKLLNSCTEGTCQALLQLELGLHRQREECPRFIFSQYIVQVRWAQSSRRLRWLRTIFEPRLTAASLTDKSTSPPHSSTAFHQLHFDHNFQPFVPVQTVFIVEPHGAFQVGSGVPSSWVEGCVKSRGRT